MRTINPNSMTEYTVLETAKMQTKPKIIIIIIISFL